MGGRTTAMGFSGSGDNNRKKFTGYERDTETGLDFAQARYFSSTQARFTSADSVLGSIANPQSLNRYAYVGNNPLNFSDPTGHMPSTDHTISSSASPNPGWGWDDPHPGFDPAALATFLMQEEVFQQARDVPGVDLPSEGAVIEGHKIDEDSIEEPQERAQGEEVIKTTTCACGKEDPQSFWQRRFSAQLQSDVPGTLIAWNDDQSRIRWIAFPNDFEHTVAALTDKGYLSGPMYFAFNPYHHSGGQEFRDPDSRWGRLSFHFMIPYPKDQIQFMPPTMGPPIIFKDRSPARGIHVHVDFHNPNTQLIPHAVDVIRDTWNGIRRRF